jgi:hypothetical protein
MVQIQDLVSQRYITRVKSVYHKSEDY